MLENNIDIYLITYNRAKALEKTFEKLLSVDSPIKNFEIKILDNASTDETEEFCHSLTQKHSNIIYHRNRINIGISGNIIKAMESASKKWLWILCDDDAYDWGNWGEIAQALKTGDFDIVHTISSEIQTYPYLINAESFLPCPIYNTRHITSQTMQNAYSISYTLLPHHAIGCKVINEKGKIFVPQKSTVIEGRSDKYNFIRTPKRELFHRIANYQILAGYIAAYQLIDDEDIRRECTNTLCIGSDYKDSMMWFLDDNDGYINNIIDILVSSDSVQKESFFAALKERPVGKYFAFHTFIEEVYPLHETTPLCTITRLINHYLTAQNPIILWGGGKFCRDLLTYTHLRDCNILFIADNNNNLRGSFLCGFFIDSPTKIATADDYQEAEIIITTPLYKNEIAMQIKSMGLMNKVVSLSPEKN